MLLLRGEVERVVLLRPIEPLVPLTLTTGFGFTIITLGVLYRG